VDGGVIDEYGSGGGKPIPFVRLSLNYAVDSNSAIFVARCPEIKRLFLMDMFRDDWIALTISRNVLTVK